MTEIIAAPRTRFYRLKKVRKSLQTPWTLSVLLVLLVALIDSANLGNVIGTALAALAGTAPYIVIAVLLIGWLKALHTRNMLRLSVTRETSQLDRSALKERAY